MSRTPTAEVEAIEPAVPRSEGNGTIDGSSPPESTGRAKSPMAGVGKHTLVYGLGIVLNKALAFVMLPLYTRVLTPTDYGVMGLIAMTTDVIAIMAGPKLVQGIYRFYHKASDRHGRNGVVSTALIALAVSYATVSAGAFLGAALLSTLVFGGPEHTGLIQLASAALAFESLMLVSLAYARVRNRSVLFVTANAVKLFLSAGLNILFLVFMGMGVAGVFLSAVITNVLVGVTLAAWVVRNTGFRFSGTAFLGLARYGAPLVVMQFATFASTFGDRYFLQASAGEHVVGLYHLAYKFGFLLIVLGHSPFTQVWEPKRFEIWDRSDRDELLARGFIYLNLLLLSTAVGIALFVRPVLQVMSDPEFHSAAILVPPILAAYVLHSWARILDIGILIRERTEYITVAEWFSAGVALLAYALLIPRYQAWGAVGATFITFVVRFTLIYFFSQRLAPVRYEWGPVHRLLAVAVAVVVAHLLLPEMGVWATFLASACLGCVFFLIVWWGGVLPKIERDRIRATVTRAVPFGRSGPGA